jgi:hypothetical protein
MQNNCRKSGQVRQARIKTTEKKKNIAKASNPQFSKCDGSREVLFHLL